MPCDILWYNVIWYDIIWYIICIYILYIYIYFCICMSWSQLGTIQFHYFMVDSGRQHHCFTISVDGWSQDLQPKMLKFHWYWFNWSPNCAQFRSLHSSGSNSPVLWPWYRLFAGANLHPGHQCPHAWPGDWPTSLCASVCTGWQGGVAGAMHGGNLT